MLSLALLACISHALCLSVPDAVPGAPTPVDTGPYASVFGPNVMLFDPSMDMSAVQATLDQLHEQQANVEFSSRRYALLFKPGEYDLDVTVDYYVHAAGLGQVPGDVRINGAVQSIATTIHNRVTLMFWRTAENFHVVPRYRPMLWAVSQAAPYRRMHIEGDVQFDRSSWASGGFLANSVVEGTAGLTSGQQWVTRNCELGRWRGGNWNRTFVGTTGAPPGDWPTRPTTTIGKTPVIRDKPFLVMDEAGRFSVFVPALARDSVGVTWAEGPEAGRHIPIDDFHVAFPDKDTADTINAALDAGRHLLLTPGIYELESEIRVRRAGAVVMGMGLATIVPTRGTPAIVTEDVPGVTVASVMVDAGLQRSRVLVLIGDQDANERHADDPTVLHDVFCRVGGAVAGSADACLVVNSHDVVIDHAWLWRADHGAGAEWDVNRSRHGLVVNGDDVTIYGLFNEHFQQHQTLWNGERGRVYFYQSEIPYDPPSQAAWRDGNAGGYASYKVADHVREHEAHGLGIYSFFGVHNGEDAGVRLRNAVEVPESERVRVIHISTFAGGHGGIDHAVNGLGATTNVGELRLYDGVGAEPLP